ncbi:MAG: S-layer homology domain-containing protein [Nodosilinea sp.]
MTGCSSLAAAASLPPMPPFFRPLPRLRLPSKRPSGAADEARLCQWVPVGLLAIAVGLALIPAIANSPQKASPTLMPATPQTQGRGIQMLFNRSRLQRPSLTVPLPVQPVPLPPQQAWPELPIVHGEPGFADLNSQHWAWPILADLRQRNLIEGFPDNTFRPAAPITRAEFATQMAQLFDLPLKQPELAEPTIYTDMAPSHWAYRSVQRAVQMGFLSGYPDAAFLPDQPISRLHVIVALANGLTLKSSSSATAILAPYSDRGQVPAWAMPALVAATEAGLVINYPSPHQLAPHRPATRAEVAVMLHRALVYTGTLSDVPFRYGMSLPEAE